jgi:hypothetical protein
VLPEINVAACDPKRGVVLVIVLLGACPLSVHLLSHFDAPRSSDYDRYFNEGEP